MCGICGHLFYSICGCCCRKNASKTEETSKLISTVPSRIRAGESLRGTNIDNISRSIGTMRNVSIQITNFTDMYTLSNPRVHTSSGYSLDPPQPTIAKKTSEACTFTNTPLPVKGCVGVLAYQILKDEKHFVGELVIMFSVPYDYIWYENYLGLGIYEQHISCDHELFNQMYYKNGPFTRMKATGTENVYFGEGICVKGTMSSAGKAIIKVEFRDSK